jgi:hypothetical protein
MYLPTILSSHVATLSLPSRVKHNSSSIFYFKLTSTVPANATGTEFFLPLPITKPGLVDTIHVFFHGLYYCTTFPFFI